MSGTAMRNNSDGFFGTRLFLREKRGAPVWVRLLPIYPQKMDVALRASLYARSSPTPAAMAMMPAVQAMTFAVRFMGTSFPTWWR